MRLKNETDVSQAAMNSVSCGHTTDGLGLGATDAFGQDKCLGCHTTEGAGCGDHAAEEAAGGIDTGERVCERGPAKK